MIGKIKYTAFVILCLIFLLFCGETAGQTLANRTDSYGTRIVFGSFYDTKQLKADISELAKKYQCEGFIILDSYNDMVKNTYYYLRGSERSIKQEIGVRKCSFNTITGPQVELELKTFDSIPDEALIDTLFIRGDNTDSFISLLGSNYDIMICKGEKTIPLPIIAGVVCSVLFLLLCLYDILSRKKDVCIALTLGQSLLLQIIRSVLKDTLFYIFTAPVVFALLIKITAGILCIKQYILFVIVQIICSSLMYFVLFIANICLTIKNKNKSYKLLIFNYILKTVSCVILIASLMFCAEIGSQLLNCSNARAFKTHLGAYSVTDIQLGSEYAKMQEEIFTHNEAIAEGSEEQRILDRYFDDLSVFYEKCSEKGDIFLLNALSPAYKAAMGGSEVDGESPNVIYASDSAGRYIADVTGIEPDKRKISILFPHDHSQTDHDLAEFFVSMYDEEFISFNYTSADIACFGAEDREKVIPTSRRLDLFSDPIVIYFPSSEKYDFLDHDHNLAVSIDKETADKIIQENNLYSLKVSLCEVSYCADKYIYDSYSQAILYVIIIAAAALYCLIIFISTVMLDIRLFQRDRAISFIQGEGFIKRSLSLTVSLLISISFSTIGAVTLCEFIGFKRLFFVYFAGAALFAFELVFSLAAIRKAEKKEGYILSSLKGGAL